MNFRTHNAALLTSSGDKMKYGLGYTLVTGITGFLSRTILPFRKTELMYMANFVKRFTGKKILDYGCNTGYFLQMLNEISPSNQYSGADINPKALARAKKKHPQFQFFNPDELDEEKFDIIIISHVLEHIVGRDGFLSQIKKNLQKDGHLLIAIPQERIRGDATIFQLMYNALRLRFVNPHVVKLNCGQLSALLDRNGFEIKENTYTNYFYPFKSAHRRFDAWSLVAVCGVKQIVQKRVHKLVKPREHANAAQAVLELT